MRRSIIWGMGLLAALTAISVVAAAQMQAGPTMANVPAGTRVLIRTIDPIDSSKQQAKQVSVPSESLLEFRLEQPATLPTAH